MKRLITMLALAAFTLSVGFAPKAQGTPVQGTEQTQEKAKEKKKGTKKKEKKKEEKKEETK